MAQLAASATERAKQDSVASGEDIQTSSTTRERDKQVRLEGAEPERHPCQKGVGAMQVKKQDIPKSANTVVCPMMAQSRAGPKESPIQCKWFLGCPCIRHKMRTETSRQAKMARDQKKRAESQADEPERQARAAGPRRVAHEEDAVPCGEPGGLLDLLHGGSIVGIGVVDELLAGGPKNRRNRATRRFCRPSGTTQRNMVVNASASPADGRNRKLSEIDARLSSESIGACHDGYSTFRQDRTRRQRARSPSLPGNF